MSRFTDLKLRLPSILAVLVAACALSFGLVACGDDDDSTDTAAETVESTTATSDGGETVAAEESAENVTVTATEYEFDLSATPNADTKTVTFKNDGKQFHVLIFARLGEGFTLDEAYKLEGKKGSAKIVGEGEAPPGKTVDVKVTEQPLEGGNYVLFCPIGSKKGPHYKLGQLQEFEIQ